MSLLMDALKWAEQNKNRQKTKEGVAAPADLGNDPLVSVALPGDDAALALDADFAQKPHRHVDVQGAAQFFSQGMHRPLPHASSSQNVFAAPLETPLVQESSKAPVLDELADLTLEEPSLPLPEPLPAVHDAKPTPTTSPPPQAESRAEGRATSRPFASPPEAIPALSRQTRLTEAKRGREFASAQAQQPGKDAALPSLPPPGERQSPTQAQHIYGPDHDQRRAQAQNLFAAKAPRSRKRNLVWGLVACLLVILTGSQGYRIWSASVSPSSMLVTQAPMPKPGSDAADAANATGFSVITDIGGHKEQNGKAQPGPDAPVAQEDDPQAGSLAADQVLQNVTAAVDPAASDMLAALQNELAAIKTQLAATTFQPTPTLAEPREDPPQPPAQSQVQEQIQEPLALFVSDLELIKAVPETSFAVQLNEAYAAFLRGDFDHAQQLYREVLDGDPKRRDALLGMAAVAVQEQRTNEALAIYSRLLELDPRDAVALAAAIPLAGSGDLVQLESRIKSQLALQPDAHALHFALGVIHLDQSRWAAAQQAFFRAVRLDPDNPDYAYNLAVSLDLLGQYQAAAVHYRIAVNLAAARPASFDTGIALNRHTLLQESHP